MYSKNDFEHTQTPLITHTHTPHETQLPTHTRTCLKKHIHTDLIATKHTHTQTCELTYTPLNTHRHIFEQTPVSRTRLAIAMLCFEVSSLHTQLPSRRRLQKPYSRSLSFSPHYGSSLTTSLADLILWARCFEPWRPDAVMGTTRSATAYVHIQPFTFRFSTNFECESACISTLCCWTDMFTIAFIVHKM